MRETLEIRCSVAPIIANCAKVAFEVAGQPAQVRNMKVFLLAATVLIVTLSLSCTQLAEPQATATSGSASSGWTGNPEERRAIVKSFIPEMEAAFGSKDAERLKSLLLQAERGSGGANNHERFESYRGTWQAMQLLYCQWGKPSDQRAVMDKVETLAKRFVQYRVEEFGLTNKC